METFKMQIRQKRKKEQDGRFNLASQVALVVRNLPADAGDIRDPGSIPGSERSLGEGNGNPLQYSCLENPWTEAPGRLLSIELQSQT